RGAVRGPASRRLDGASSGTRAGGEGARPQDHLDRGSDRVPSPSRASGGADGLGADPDRARRVHRAHLRELRRRDGARRARAGRGGRRRADPGAGALGVPHRRRVRLDAVRLWRPAARCTCPGRQGGPRRDPVYPGPRGACDRADAQAPRLPPPGGGTGHRRGQRRARVRGGPARLRDRRPDPGGPRRALHAAAHQQPRQTGRARGLWAVALRAGAARDAPHRGEHRLPAHQAREAGPPARQPRARGRAVSELRGDLHARGRRFAIAVARFNALPGLHANGVAEEDVDVVWVPGAFELPLVARRLARSRTFDAVICLGAVIRGETAHFELIAGQAAAGIREAADATGVPVTFGVLTTETLEQALDRAGGKHGNKGWDAATAAIEMASLLEQLPKEAEPCSSTTPGERWGLTPPTS